MRIFFSLFIFVAVNLFAASANAQSKDKIAIVIDDIGYRATDKTALQLPKQVTFSVLPHTPFGRELAEQGNQQQREILLHVPMESINNLLLGPGALTSTMDEANVKKTLAASIADIPHVIGINNHMGSLLTQKSDPMSWTMQFLKDNDLFFLDSRTSKYSQAEYIAQRVGVPSLHRHIFLDNKIDEHYIEQQFKKLIRSSKRNGAVVAIAHPHPATVRVLKKMIPTLAARNIELVTISQLLPLETPSQISQQKIEQTDQHQGE
ncbi:divergent polysaccharide deacetylase family protein [Thalassotalea psychrophila]|uniref:Divergent polysaccharide deacetylase family protein n=1 Tax=Thalassotalea psychrophila TaxID=3065647 RepID=A0ABY9TUM8_9GAMM|nr:divergent polysaccharide deacetylase family protein [Colwelliaceae bacterium SQ149]